MTAEEFDALSFHKGMVVQFLEPKTVTRPNPTRIMGALISYVIFNDDTDGGGGVLYHDEKGRQTFVHYSRIVSIK